MTLTDRATVRRSVYGAAFLCLILLFAQYPLSPGAPGGPLTRFVAPLSSVEVTDSPPCGSVEDIAVNPAVGKGIAVAETLVWRPREVNQILCQVAIGALLHTHAGIPDETR